MNEQIRVQKGSARGRYGKSSGFRDHTELYMPMIEHNSYLYGRLDEDLKQYILIHIALNISKFKI